MFKEMGYNPQISLVSSFNNSNLLNVWKFFFGTTLCCLTVRSCGMDKAKPQFYYVMSSLYYGMKVEYASLI